MNTAQSTTIKLSDVATFKQKALRWAMQFNHAILFDSNHYTQDKYSKIEWKLAVDAIDFIQPVTNFFAELDAFKKSKNEDFICGFLRYDILDAEIGKSVVPKDELGFPPLFFFQPRYIFELNGDRLTVNRNYPETYEITERINAIAVEDLGKIYCNLFFGTNA